MIGKEGGDLTQRREGGKDAKIDHIALDALRLGGLALRWLGNGEEYGI